MVDSIAVLAFLPWGLVLAGAMVLVFVLGFLAAPLWVWSLAGFVLLVALGAPIWLLVVFVLVVGVLNVPAARRHILSGPIMRAMTRFGFLPTISETERVAIEAGTVWIEGELFSGKPDFGRILAETYPELTAEEQAFLDGPVEEVCHMADEWTTLRRRDLPPEAWDFIKRERFFGMIIPEEYGGLGFSALANSAVVQKLASRNGVLSTTVMVPNSLGPAELLIHFGTDEQRDHYLPRLATGEDIPAFALTEPNAGSDAGAISSSGEVFRGEDGELYVRLNWNKRYITLAAIATVLGLAFRLRDPENLLGQGAELGITCALVPTDTAGVEANRRHDPLGAPFYNCPTTGENVVLPLDWAVIGGRAGVGQGWRMLMESLAAGRGISLPASASGQLKLTTRTASGHARVRQQFGLPIGKFEGIEEPLARLGGYLYTLDAARHFTCGGIMAGAKPAVVTAMAKYYFTELAREGINDGMDILAGNAISHGPRNMLAGIYHGAPIAITVEGANILTRTLMVFGQGAIRCHPFAYRELEALAREDLTEFDDAFWRHAGHVIVNLIRSFGLSISRGYLAAVPLAGPTRRYWQKLAWTSATFALLADVAMGTLGGNLKRKGKLTGRFADIFSWMYLGTAVLRRYEAEGRREEDLPFVAWAMDHAFWRIQRGFDGLFDNLRVPGLTWLMRGPLAAWNRLNRIGSLPGDRLGRDVARALQVPGDQRDRMTAGMYVPADPEQALGRLERAFRLAHEAAAVQSKLRRAVRDGRLPRRLNPDELVRRAIDGVVISREEADLIETATRARDDYIQVDSFTLEEYMRGAVESGRDQGEDESSDAEPVPRTTGQAAFGAATVPAQSEVSDD